MGPLVQVRQVNLASSIHVFAHLQIITFPLTLSSKITVNTPSLLLGLHVTGRRLLLLLLLPSWRHLDLHVTGRFDEAERSMVGMGVQKVKGHRDVVMLATVWDRDSALQCAVCTEHCALCTVHCALCTEQSAMCSV